MQSTLPRYRRDFARREMLQWTGGALLLAALPGCSERRSQIAAGSAWPSHDPRPASAPQPVVASQQQCALTEDNILGPYYLPGAPERANLRGQGMEGTLLDVVGTVRSVDCRPLAHAELEVWQADHRGAYDVAGPTLRGLLRADEEGCYRLSTIIPGRYLNGAQYRPAHIHFRIVAARHRALVTQLYFAGDPYNGVDPYVRPSLIVPLEADGANRQARFDIVLAPG